MKRPATKASLFACLEAPNRKYVPEILKIQFPIKTKRASTRKPPSLSQKKHFPVRHSTDSRIKFNPAVPDTILNSAPPKKKFQIPNYQIPD